MLLINRLQNLETFREPNLPKDYLKDLSDNSTDKLLGIIAIETATMLRHLHLSGDEVAEFTDQVKARDMAVLFEYFEDVDISAERRKAKEEGLAEGRAEGRAEGEARFAKLPQLLLESGCTDDLSRAVSNSEFRQELYLRYNL